MTRQIARWRVGLTGLLVFLATVSPALVAPTDDAFPLSTYPMFARNRGTQATVTSANAIDRNGRRSPVPPGLIANAETMQALQTLRKTVRAGAGPSAALCRSIAERIRNGQAPDLADSFRVEISTNRVATIPFLRGEASPKQVQLHARCAVGEGRP